MSDRVARVLGGLTLLGLLLNLVLTWRVGRQLDALADETAHAQPGGPSAAGFVQALQARRAAKAAEHNGAGGAGPHPAGLPGEEGDDLAAGAGGAAGPPEVVARRKERLEQIQNDWRDAAMAEVEAYGKDAHLDGATVDAVLDELLSTSDAVGALREDIRAERVSIPDGKVQLREIKDASDRRLDDLLGPERASELRERLKETRPF